jgi:hypothetical protein
LIFHCLHLVIGETKNYRLLTVQVIKRNKTKVPSAGQRREYIWGKIQKPGHISLTLLLPNLHLTFQPGDSAPSLGKEAVKC